MQRGIISTGFTGTSNVQENRAHHLYLPYLSHSLHIKYSFHSSIHTVLSVLLKKRSCFLPPIDALQIQGSTTPTALQGSIRRSSTPGGKSLHFPGMERGSLHSYSIENA